MFHILGKCYLDLKSSRVASINKQIDFSELNFKPNDEALWRFFQTSSQLGETLVVYVEPEDLLKLQLTLWKNIFPHSDLDSLYQLHKIYIEDYHLRSFLSSDKLNTTVRTGYLQVKKMMKSEFEHLYSDIEGISVIKSYDKKHLSFEYQLAEYFYNNQTVLKSCVLDKIKKFTWGNWLAELEVLKGDILNGILDINKLLPDQAHIDVQKTDMLFAQFAANPYLNWALDPQLTSNNYDYIEQTYSKDIFHTLYSRFYNLWQVNGEDMSELIDLIYGHRYEELLTRDVKRGFGSVYSAGRFRHIINQIFVSWLYAKKRDEALNSIAPYRLY